MRKDYAWNETEDLRRIEEGIANLNQQLENIEQEQAQEDDDEQEGGNLWPSITGQI